MTGREISRRTVLRTSGALAGAGLLGTVAGCQSMDSLSSLGGGSGGRADSIPEDATVVFSADVAAIYEDEELLDAIDDLLGDVAAELGTAEVDSVEESTAAFESSLGLDPEALSEVVAFGEAESDSEYSAVLCWADWDEDDVVDAVEDQGADVEEDSHEGRPIYVSDHTGQAMGVVSEGVYALGAADAVEDAIDVSAADGDAISGGFRSAFTDTEGVLRFATAVEDSELPATPTPSADGVSVEGLDEVEYASGALGSADGERTLTLSFVAADADAAEDVAATLDDGRSVATEELDAAEPSTEFQQQYADGLSTALEDAELSTSDRTVTATYTDDPESVVAVAAAPLLLVLVNTAGFLQSQAEETGEQSSEQVTDRLQVVSAVGTAIADRTIGVVEVTVKKAPGADDIDLSTNTAQWVSSDGTYTTVATATDAPGADGAFAVQPFRDDNDSIPVLDDPADRAVLRFDLGDPDGVGVSESGTFGEALEEGETATIQFTTRTGGETTATLVVPESLSGKDAVSL